MTILFLSGSLEPGRDGVGDYILRLASELVKQGYKAAAMALNDQYLTQESEGNQCIEGIALQVLRLPSSWSESKRFKRAKEWVAMLNPEWLSLQFVPFSFHSKGLPFGLGRQLRDLGDRRRWHIMFHELWVGMNINSSIKFFWLGWLQKKLIRRLIINLNPCKIHTQTRLYQAQLIKLGFATDYLPLFGNIPIVKEPNIISNKESGPLKSKKAIKLVLFGAIHPGAPIDEFANEVAEFTKNFDVPVYLTLIGRCGAEQVRWATIWKSAGLVLEVLGEQSTEYISKIFSNASLGLSTTPIALAEKSGTIAAMLEHRLPVLCIAQPWQPRGITSLDPLPGIWEYRYGNLETYFNQKQYFPYINKVEKVSRKLTDSLSAST